MLDYVLYSLKAVEVLYNSTVNNLTPTFSESNDSCDNGQSIPRSFPTQ